MNSLVSPVSTLSAFVGMTFARPGHILNSRQSFGSGTYNVTPHNYYSSSVGVLGCKINYNRVAYWPMAVDCDSMCVKLTWVPRKVRDRAAYR